MELARTKANHCHPERSVYSRAVKDLDDQGVPDSRVESSLDTEILRYAEYGYAQDDKWVEWAT
jgi:hypothetical protein